MPDLKNILYCLLKAAAREAERLKAEAEAEAKRKAEEERIARESKLTFSL